MYTNYFISVLTCVYLFYMTFKLCKENEKDNIANYFLILLITFQTLIILKYKYILGAYYYYFLFLKITLSFVIYWKINQITII